jgi:histone acetyltransferase MYST1
VVEFVEEEYGGGMDEASIREHEEVTKIKNVNEIVLGRHVIPTWYFSPIPKELYPDGSLDRLHISEFTLNMYQHARELERHYKTCTIRHPPGDEIYRDEHAKVSMFEVDGVKAKIYCQNLCYLAKFFLDHKTLHYDVDPFLFYVLCEFDDRGYHIVGYFSKEKYSEPGYNLACILTLPSYQRMGYGKFLISFSYELSKKEKKVGSPEKPLSDLGQISYRSYWSRALLQVLVNLSDEVKNMSVMDLTKRTSIKTEDVMATLTHLGILQYVVGGKFVLVMPKQKLKEMLAAIKIRGPEVNPEFLHWAPLKVDVKRDKWAISSKRKESSADAGGLNGITA